MKKYSNWNIKKTGDNVRNRYKYQGSVEVTYEKRCWLFGKIDSETKIETFSFHEPYNGWPELSDLEAQALSNSENIKSEDECCISPDMETCNTYPLHDIILDFLLGNDDCGVKDYCFKVDQNDIELFNKELEWEVYKRTSCMQHDCVDKKYLNNIRRLLKQEIDGPKGYIKFLYQEDEYKYEVDLHRNIKERVCLSCEEMDKSDEESAIYEFREWFNKEKELKHRKKEAKRLCELNKHLLEVLLRNKERMMKIEINRLKVMEYCDKRVKELKEFAEKRLEAEAKTAKMLDEKIGFGYRTLRLLGSSGYGSWGYGPYGESIKEIEMIKRACELTDSENVSLTKEEIRLLGL